MDLMWKTEFEGGDNQLNGFVHSVPSSVTSKHASSRLLQNKPLRHHFMDDVLSSYLSCNHDGFELFVGCEDGLFNVCELEDNKIEPDVVRWKCIAKRGEAFYEELTRKMQKEECLAALGVGKVPKKMPEFIQKNFYRRMRPTTSTNGTQAKSRMSESGSQTYWSGLRTRDTASQAIQQTVDCGVQAKPMTVESGTCTLAVQTSTDSGVQMTTTDYSDQCASRPSQGDQCVTLQVNLSMSKLNRHKADPVSIKVNGITMKLNKEDSALVESIARRALANKAKHTRDSSADAHLIPHASEMGQKGFARGIFQPPPKCGSGDLQRVWQGSGPNVDDKTGQHGELLQKSGKCNAGQMSAGEGVVRYHEELPFYKHNEKYLSITSPFSKFGYGIVGNIPQTLKDIRIPVVYPKDVTFQKGQNGSEVLGSGSFGCVYLAKHEQYQFDVCVKEFEMDSSTIYDIHHEAKLLIYLQTTKFVPFCLGLMESPFVSSDLSLIQECYAQGCTLRMLLRNNPPVFAKRKWIAICYQLVWGLRIIHEKHVLLNDIKSDNILVDYNSNDIMSNVRFIDLGLASFRRGYRFCNDPAYLEQFENYAPEIRQGYHSTPASDLYAVGYLMDKISETFNITEIDSIAQSCTVGNLRDRPSCQSVLEKLEDVMENM